MAAATGFNQMLQSLAQMDFFSGVLPFVLTYVLFFFITKGLFKRMDIFPEDNETTAAAIVSLAFAFYTARFLLMNPTFQQFFLQYLGRVALIVIGLLGLLIVLAVVGYDLLRDDNDDAALIGWVLVLLAVGAFWVSGGMAIFFPGQTSNQLWNSVMDVLRFAFRSGLIWMVLVIALLLATMRGDNGDRTRVAMPMRAQDE